MDYQYPYATGDLLEERNTYTYTPFLGKDFIEGWLTARKSVLKNLPDPAPAPRQSDRGRQESVKENGLVSSKRLLEYLLSAYLADERTEDAEQWLAWIIQRFEVTKRLYAYYHPTGKAVTESGYRDLEFYLVFGEVLAVAYRVDEKLPLLNAFLKSLDTLCALHQTLSAEQKSRLSRLIGCEWEFIEALTANEKV